LKIDYLIVGCGLAGSILGYQLLEKGKKILIIDSFKLNSASNIAAGTLNPVVFKRLSKSWNVDLFLPFMEKFYQKIEFHFSEKIYYPKETHKIIANSEEKAFWEKKAYEEDVKDYLNKEIESIYKKELINENEGIGIVKKSGYLDITKMINRLKSYFQEKSVLLEEYFDYQDLKLTDQGIFWKNFQTAKIIFAEGSRAKNNPFFSWLPFRVTKGEIITIKTEINLTEDILYKGVFILPIGNNHYKVGSTYSWKEEDYKITEKAKNELCEKLEKIIKIPYEIVNQQAGIRPNTEDRRPFIGESPNYRHVFIFNGLGSKGVLMAPFLAKNFISILLNEENNLPKEWDIKRFIQQSQT